MLGRAATKSRRRSGARLALLGREERAGEKIKISVDRPAPVSRFRNLRSASDGGAGNAIEISVPANLPAVPLMGNNGLKPTK
jgi:hypothetical protein